LKNKNLENKNEQKKKAIKIKKKGVDWGGC
jgi:hypothetical protein